MTYINVAQSANTNAIIERTLRLATTMTRDVAIHRRDGAMAIQDVITRARDLQTFVGDDLLKMAAMETCYATMSFFGDNARTRHITMNELMSETERTLSLLGVSGVSATPARPPRS